MSKPGPRSAIQFDETHDLAPFRRPMAPIPERVEQAISSGVRHEPFASPDDFARSVNETGEISGPIDAAVRNVDEQLFVACLTDMPGVTAAMWDWWFSWHSYTSERYQLWHPQDHVAASIVEDRHNATTIRERWVGNVSFVDEYIGGELQRLAIRFVAPATVGFDPDVVDHIGLAVCARTVLRRERLAAGHLVHLLENTAVGCRMHSRFWLGDATSEIPVIGPVVTRLGNRPALRKRLLPDTTGLALLRHCSEEMNHLASILPELHRHFGQE